MYIRWNGSAVDSSEGTLKGNKSKAYDDDDDDAMHTQV